MLALALVALAAVFVFTREGETPVEEGAPGVSAGEVEYKGFVDPETGIALEYPETWIPIARPEGDLRLALSAGGGLDSLLVRVGLTEQPIGEAEVETMKTFTDGIIRPADVQILNEGPAQLNGMTGYSYLYRFIDAETGQTGTHLHYFLFQGRKMHTIVFQVLPIENPADFERFDARKREFDQILATFTSDPAILPAE